MKIFYYIKKGVLVFLLFIFSLYISGCALIGTAVSAAAAYGIYKVIEKNK